MIKYTHLTTLGSLTQNVLLRISKQLLNLIDIKIIKHIHMLYEKKGHIGAERKKT